MNREEELLQLIRKNPMITQDEIAATLGIKRSTVGVHILNLQKKGLLLGRGYLFNDENYVLGFGSANIDIYGKTNGEIRPHYDHPGKVATNIGGVTHNILENLVHLGVSVKLITAVGDDLYGKEIIEESERVGMDVSNVLRVADATSGIFMQVMDENNDMHMAMTDFRVMQKIDESFVKSKGKVISAARVVVCDPAMPIESLKELLNHGTPVFIDPTSEALAEKIADIAHQFAFIKPNRAELSAITKMKVDTDEETGAACRYLIDKGLKMICVSLGDKGCLYMDDRGTVLRRSLKPVENMVNASGAGDSFMAAFIYGYINGLDIEQTIDYAMAAGAAAITTKSTINDELSVSLLDKILKENKL